MSDVLQLLRKKARVAFNEALYRCVNFLRPVGDRFISSVAQSEKLSGTGLMLIEGLWDHPYHWLRLAMMRCAFAEKIEGLVGIYESGAPVRVRRSLRNVGVGAEERIPSGVPEKHLSEAVELLAPCATTRSILDMSLPFNFPAHHFYDGVLKDEELGTVTPHHPRLRTYLARLLQYLEFYDGLFARRDIRVVVVSHANFPRFSALVWCALRRNIPVYSTIHVNEHLSARKFGTLADCHGNLSDRPSVAIRDALTSEERQVLIDEGRRYYSQVRSRQIGQFSILDIYGGENQRSREEFAKAIGSDSRKRNVVILTSCWSDGPNGGGSTYFTDYQDLLERTLSVIARVKDCNWILRPHPAEFMYGDKMRLAGLVAGRLPSNAFLWPSEFSGNAIPTVADCVVTPAGTSGIEYTALGLPVLICRDTSYTSWEFATWASSERDFADKLASASSLPAPTDRQREDAFIFMALTFTSPPNTRGQYLYQWGSKSWRIWPSVPRFIMKNRDSIRREIAMLKSWISSSTDSYNVYKWLHRESW